MPNNKNTFEYKCQSIYWNLLKLQQKDVYAASYLRELFKTYKCDTQSDLSELRKLHSDFLGEDLTDRVINYKTNHEDEIKVAEAVNHYYYWSEKNLVDSLNIKNKIYYYTIEKSEQTLAALGIISATYGGWKIIKNTYQKIKNKK